MNAAVERRLLQGAVAVAALVPIGGGALGVIHGLHGATMTADSHGRYLSGVLLGIGLAFWACIPAIERRGEAVRVLGGIVILGGMARLAATPFTGLGLGVLFALIMELIVTVLLVLWRERVERRVRQAA